MTQLKNRTLNFDQKIEVYNSLQSMKDELNANPMSYRAITPLVSQKVGYDVSPCTVSKLCVKLGIHNKVEANKSKADPMSLRSRVEKIEKYLSTRTHGAFDQFTLEQEDAS